MNKLNSVIVSVSLAASLCSCGGPVEKEQQQSLMEISKQELATALTERDQLLSLVKEVSEGLRQIKELENMMTIAASAPEENANSRARILADISVVKQKIQQRKKQLKELEDSLQESTINNKELKETIEALRLQIDSQIEEIESLRLQLSTANEHIGQLNSRVDSLNTTVNTITGERDSVQTESVNLSNELNTCYYAVASKSELESHKIIKTGFLRKTKFMKGDFDKTFFNVSDKRRLDTLQLHSKKVNILTNHPQSSYKLIDQAGLKTLIITDSDEFWSLTNYLVVQQD